MHGTIPFFWNKLSFDNFCMMNMKSIHKVDTIILFEKLEKVLAHEEKSFCMEQVT